MARSHPAEASRRNRMRHGASSDSAATMPNCGLSRRLPMPAPGEYSSASICSRLSGSTPASAAARARHGRNGSGSGTAFWKPPPLKSQRHPNEAVLWFPRSPERKMASGPGPRTGRPVRVLRPSTELPARRQRPWGETAAPPLPARPVVRAYRSPVRYVSGGGVTTGAAAIPNAMMNAAAFDARDAA